MVLLTLPINNSCQSIVRLLIILGTTRRDTKTKTMLSLSVRAVLKIIICHLRLT